MTPERWQQIREMLEKALSLAPGERAAFLDGACSSDSSLRREVETLLASSDGVLCSFLKSSPLRAPLISGTRLGEYEVKLLLGAGGMGEVYRARDSRLGRDVAIKVLPSLHSADSNRLRRFEQEARAAAALNHPNILAVFQMGTYEGAPYMVSELLEGETLRECIQRGRLAVRRAIDYGMQIARGLAAAHEKGIVHRDLKPENLFVTKDGRVKILDFGLAKLTQPQSSSEHNAPTLTKGTEPGVVMGTVGYMSPEQVRGQMADHRTDIFAFGAILYEMLAGKRAFQKATSAETMSAILNEDPLGISQVTTSVPPALQRVAHRCLEKNPEQRFQSASDLAFALDALSESGEATLAKSAATQERRKAGRTMLYGAIVTIMLLALGLAFRASWNGEAVYRKPLNETQLTHNPAENPILASTISPDGKHLAYADMKGLHLCVLETREVHDISLPDDLRTNLLGISWFSDGEKLLLTTGSESEGYTMWVASIFGGAPRKLRTESTWPAAAVSPEGTSIAFVGGQGHEIWVMGEDGESPHRIVTHEKEQYRALAWSPTTDRLAYLRSPAYIGARTIETISLSGGPPLATTSDFRTLELYRPSLLWMRDGRLLFSSADAEHPGSFDLWALKVDPQTGKPRGKPARITDSHGSTEWGASASRDGRLLVVNRESGHGDVYVGELKENGYRLDHSARLTLTESDDWPSDWTPDSKAVLFTSDRTGREQIFRQVVGKDVAEALSPGHVGDAPELNPRITADGRWILYWVVPNNAETASVMRLPVSGGPAEKVWDVRTDDSVGFRCSARANHCILGHAELGQLIFYSFDPVQGRGKELVRTKLGPNAPNALRWAASPDSLSIAIVDKEQPGDQVRVMDLRSGRESNLQLPAGWNIRGLSWAADSDSLFAVVSLESKGSFITRIEFDGKTDLLLDQRHTNRWLRSLAPSPDGHYLAFGGETEMSNAWVLENF